MTFDLIRQLVLQSQKLLKTNYYSSCQASKLGGKIKLITLK